MSKDKIRPLMKAVADLPVHHTGLALDVMKSLNSVGAEYFAGALQNLLHFFKSQEVEICAASLQDFIQCHKVRTTSLTNQISNDLLIEFFDKVTVNVTEPVKVDEFFVSRAGLFVERGFIELFTGKQNCDTRPLGSVDFSKYSLKKNCYNREIIAKLLPEGYIFEADEFFQILSSLLQKQWNGEVGSLIVNGYANLFYVLSKDKKQVLVVSVGYESVSRMWGSRVLSLSSDRLLSGSVVFSRN